MGIIVAFLYGLALSNGLVLDCSTSGLSSLLEYRLPMKKPEKNEIEIKQTMKMAIAVFFFSLYHLQL